MSSLLQLSRKRYVAYKLMSHHLTRGYRKHLMYHRPSLSLVQPRAETTMALISTTTPRFVVAM
jgi:hypothetical protein